VRVFIEVNVGGEASKGGVAPDELGALLDAVLSMGMSHDFEIAIEEGATLVRVGTAIFGARTAAGSAA